MGDRLPTLMSQPRKERENMKLTLKQARAGKYTQSDMAKALGVSLPTYVAWEKKPIEDLALRDIKKVAEITGVRVTDLTGGLA